KKFGSRSLIALKRIEEASLIKQYPQLIEISGKKVAQAEHTIIITEKEKIVTTL
ncbi:type II methionyl aminopeptidase, partial [Candidatus Pacearchaeota archaeon]|nr:type II methionyl aminopeptidase [Candidatus Pacearchaeota archaeon]